MPPNLFGDGHQVEFLDLPQLSSPDTVHSDSDSSSLARSDVYGRRRPRRVFHGKFWETVDFMSHQYKLPTALEPFPILSRHYVYPVRICDWLATRSSASPEAIEFADNGWTSHYL